MPSLDVLLLFNEPVLDTSDPDRASEAGVLEAAEGIRAALERTGHRVTMLGIGSDLRPLLSACQNGRFDATFNLCEGFGGVGYGESQVAGLLELFGLEITGSPSECLSLVRDKMRTKLLLAGAGLPTPEFLCVAPERPLDAQAASAMLALGPVFVKPAHEDASLGIGAESVAKDFEALERQIAHVAARYGAVLVERFVAGREFNATVVALPQPRLLPLAEIEFDPSADRCQHIVSYKAKWDSGSSEDLATRPRCPAEVPVELARELERIALAAFELTGCRDYARIDLRVDEQNQPFILEVNGNPDLTPGAGVSRALDAAEIRFEDFVDRLVRQASARRAPRTTRAECAAPQRDAQRHATTEQSVAPDPTGALGTDTPIKIRSPHTDDLSSLRNILERCPEFRPEEVAIGEEVVRDALAGDPSYQVLVAEADGQVLGWACYGEVPLTEGTFDLYWIAVDPSRQRSGIGRALLNEVETRLRAAQARWLLAETSGTPQYYNTRRFYERAGYARLSEIPDFYRAADGRVIFGKRLQE